MTTTSSMTRQEKEKEDRVFLTSSLHRKWSSIYIDMDGGIYDPAGEDFALTHTNSELREAYKEHPLTKSELDIIRRNIGR